MSQIVNPLPAGAMTFTGKTYGPAVNMGRARPHQIGGRMLYMHEQEAKDVIAKFGWHQEEEYQKLLAEYEERGDRLADADVKITELEQKVADFEAAFGWKPEAKPEAPKAAPKRAAKATTKE